MTEKDVYSLKIPQEGRKICSLDQTILNKTSEFEFQCPTCNKKYFTLYEQNIRIEDDIRIPGRPVDSYGNINKNASIPIAVLDEKKDKSKSDMTKLWKEMAKHGIRFNEVSY